MKFILTFLFGERAQGERLHIPSLPAMRPLVQEDYNRWSAEFKVGSRYGTKGSFYFNR